MADATEDRMDKERKPEELFTDDALTARKQEIDTRRAQSERISDDHISRYVGNWAGSGYTGTDWALGYNDAPQAPIDSGSHRGGQLARCYLTPSDSRTGTSTTSTRGSLVKMEAHNCQALKMKSLAPSVVDYGEPVRLTEATRKMLILSDHAEKKHRAPIHRATGLGRFTQNQPKRVPMASSLTHLAAQVRFREAILAMGIRKGADTSHGMGELGSLARD